MSDSEQINNYIGQLFTSEDEVLQWITAEAERNNMPSISVEAYDGYLLQWLIRMISAKKIVEIGTLAGYSGTWMARALPNDGRLYTLEISPLHAQVAAASFKKAGVSGKVEILLGNAQENFKKVEAYAPFDFVFIDADKGSYPAYLAWAIENVRPGGLIAAHNALRGGRVINPENDDERTISQFNQQIADDPRLDGMMIPLGDGMIVARKK